MNGITVTMAIVDFIPIALFFAAALILQLDLYNKMVKGAFALLASGSILVLIGGIYKASWKILYALGICDFQALDISFFPMQSPGFILVFLALSGMFTKYNVEATSGNSVMVKSLAIPIYTGNIIFIIGQTLGCAGTQWCLFAIAMRMKKKLAALLFVVSFIFMLGMGYLCSQFDDSSSMHWMAQCINIVSQGSLLGGVIILDRAGLIRKDALIK